MATCGSSDQSIMPVVTQLSHLDRSEQDHGDCERGRCYGREYGDAGADLHLCCAVYCYGECGGGVSFRTYGKEIFVILLLDFWMQDVRREERAGC